MFFFVNQKALILASKTSCFDYKITSINSQLTLTDLKVNFITKNNRFIKKSLNQNNIFFSDLFKEVLKKIILTFNVQSFLWMVLLNGQLVRWNRDKTVGLVGNKRKKTLGVQCFLRSDVYRWTYGVAWFL